MNNPLCRFGMTGLLVVAILTACGGPPNNGGGGGGGGDPAVVTAAAAGEFHSLARLEDGSVLAWGLNNDGQLGNGTTTSSWTPVPVSVLTDVTAVAAGRFHSLALTEDGQVFSWGGGEHGELGRTATSANTPGQVTIAAEIVAIAAANHNSYALDTDGGLWAWGYNANYNLGDGTTSEGRATPALIAGLPPVRQVAPAANFVLALTEDEGVWAWGVGTGYPLGTGSTDDEPVPVRVTALDAYDIMQLATGWAHALALLEDGTVLGWGANHQGQLGGAPASPATRPTPTVLDGVTGIAGVAAAFQTSAAVGAAGGAVTWGANNNGILGTGSDATMTGTPGTVDLTSAVSLASSSTSRHFLAVHADGTVSAWGWNAYGQLGDGANADRNEPVGVDLP